MTAASLHAITCRLCQTLPAGSACPHCVGGVYATDNWGRPVPCDACDRGKVSVVGEGERLEYAVLLDPDDDIPRLVYADWLEENARESECPRCGGEAIVRSRTGACEYEECPDCRGAGRVCDGRDRAEFIRNQIGTFGRVAVWTMPPGTRSSPAPGFRDNRVVARFRPGAVPSLSPGDFLRLPAQAAGTGYRVTAVRIGGAGEGTEVECEGVAGPIPDLTLDARDLAALRDRAGVLYRANLTRWFGDGTGSGFFGSCLASLWADDRVTRGFVGRMRCGVNALIRTAAAVFACHPVTAVELTDLNPDAAPDESSETTTYRWLAFGHPYPEVSADPRRIPEWAARHTPGFKYHTPHPSREAAMAEAALVWANWSRSTVRLPPLPLPAPVSA